MKVIIAGGRDFNNYSILFEKCERILKDVTSEIEVVNGLAKGADTLGGKFAKEKGYKTKEFPADWTKGKIAGYLRNNQMAKYADALIAFWDGKSKGTKSMIELAKKYNLKIRILYYEDT